MTLKLFTEKLAEEKRMEAENDRAKYISLAEAQARYGISAKTLYRHVKAKTFPSFKPLGKILVRPKDIEALFARSRTESA